jgi:hypothetical protein
MFTFGWNQRSRCPGIPTLRQELGADVSIEIKDVSAMKPFVAAMFNPVAKTGVSSGKDFRSWGYTGLFAAVKPKRAMWWRSMKPRHLAGVGGRSLRNER